MMMMNPENRRRYTVGVLVSNEPGVLSRVSGLFSRRGFNIESLAVGPTQDSEVSRRRCAYRAARSAAL